VKQQSKKFFEIFAEFGARRGVKAMLSVGYTFRSSLERGRNDAGTLFGKFREDQGMLSQFRGAALSVYGCGTIRPASGTGRRILAPQDVQRPGWRIVPCARKTRNKRIIPLYRKAGEFFDPAFLVNIFLYFLPAAF